ncbi:putative basic proline-rich protein-like isoform X1 [Iris pallida]|uniref:Basic proline-rich protein-like isoform X1 n=1 Tax=Iris pallida TaxID=29817 RepID=A0AAX6GGP3_IRIPA|nr:putative basic proline-rich protein-like isoform X1 [Iris pallida]
MKGLRPEVVDGQAVMGLFEGDWNSGDVGGRGAWSGFGLCLDCGETDNGGGAGKSREAEETLGLGLGAVREERHRACRIGCVIFVVSGVVGHDGEIGTCDPVRRTRSLKYVNVIKIFKKGTQSRCTKVCLW